MKCCPFYRCQLSAEFAIIVTFIKTTCNQVAGSVYPTFEWFARKLASDFTCKDYEQMRYRHRRSLPLTLYLDFTWRRMLSCASGITSKRRQHPLRGAFVAALPRSGKARGLQGTFETFPWSTCKAMSNFIKTTWKYVQWRKSSLELLFRI